MNFYSDCCVISAGWTRKKCWPLRIRYQLSLYANTTCNIPLSRHLFLSLCKQCFSSLLTHFRVHTWTHTYFPVCMHTTSQTCLDFYFSSAIFISQNSLWSLHQWTILAWYLTSTESGENAERNARSSSTTKKCCFQKFWICWCLCRAESSKKKKKNWENSNT